MALDPTQLRGLAERSRSRTALWVALVNEVAAREVAEIGVYRGDFAAALLDRCPTIARYYMVDPWRHLDDWNKPANKEDDVFAGFYDETMEKTAAHEGKRVVLRGTTAEVVGEIPDGALDFAYVDGDHTLRGIAIDLNRVYPKLRDGGLIGGDDFRTSIWQHGDEYEPTFVFPYAVYFAEAVGTRVYGLPYNQFLLEKGSNGYEFLDLTGRYAEIDVRSQLGRPSRLSTLVPWRRRASAS